MDALPALDRRTPFRGSVARRTGALTRAQLAGAGVRRLVPDVYVDADVPVDLRLRAAALLVWQPHGVIGGLAAAALWGAWEPEVGTIEIVLGRSGARAPTGVRVRFDRLPAGEVATHLGLRLTDPVRTAFDVGRHLPPVEAVMVLDALGRLHRVGVADVHRLAAAHRHAAGLRRLRGLLELVSPLSRSGLATRVRLGLAGRAGIAVPVLSPSLPGCGGRVAVPDLAWPEERVALFAGGEPGRIAREEAELIVAGWTVLRLGRSDVARGSDVYGPAVARVLRDARERAQASSARREARESASAADLSSR